MIKLVLRSVLAICLLTVMMPCATMASNSALTVSHVTGYIGQEVAVHVSLANNPGIASFTLILGFDKDILEPVSIEQGAAVNVGKILSNMHETNVQLNQLDFVSAFWHYTNNITTNGVSYTVKFKLKEEGSTPLTLTYEPGGVSDQKPANVNPSIVNGSVTAQHPPVLVPTLRLQTTDIDQTGQFNAIVSLGNNPGIAGFTFELNFDKDKLEPVNIVANDVLGEITSNITQAGSQSLDFVSAVWYDVDNFYDDITLFTVKFNVKPHAIGSTQLYLTYDSGAVTDKYFNDVVLHTVDAIIKLTDYDDYVMTIEQNSIIKQGDVISGVMEIVITNNGIQTPTAVISLAVYAKDGRLIDIKSVGERLISLGDNSISFAPISIQNANSSEYYVKIICWEKWMQPILEALPIELVVSS